MILSKKKIFLDKIKSIKKISVKKVIKLFGKNFPPPLKCKKCGEPLNINRLAFFEINDKGIGVSGGCIDCFTVIKELKMDEFKND